MRRVSLLLFATVVIRRGVGALEGIEWLTLAVGIPVPASDIGATFVPTFANSSMDRDTIVITGGCVSNNTLVPNTTLFACSEITDAAFGFDPTTETFAALPDMLRPRYRHDAAFVRNRLYLVGGRDSNDTEIAQIDCFDPVEYAWSTLLTLPSDYVTSDNGAFGYDDYLHVVGGFQGSEYLTLNANIRIHLDTLEITPMAPMNVARGDFRAVQYGDDGDVVAYVLGGYTSANNFSTPLEDVEMYTVSTDEWTTMSSLLKARADMATVVLNGQLLAVGGETNTGNYDETDPGSFAVVVDDVESYDLTTNGTMWRVQSDLESKRFRFAGAPWDATDTIYLFGGQDEFDFTCSCYTTSDEVIAYRANQPPTTTTTSSAIPSHPPSLACGGILTMAVTLFWYTIV